MGETKIYVGDLPRDASEKELERAFSYYGSLRSVWVARNPPGFGFVIFDDARDADDAVNGLDGSKICGVKVRVELSSGKSRPKPWTRGSRAPSRLRRPFSPDDRCYECGGRGHYAYDCRRSGRRPRRSRSRSRQRSYSRSRSRENFNSRSRSRSRGRGRSPVRNRSYDRDV